MAVGCPVICSNNSSLPEVVGNAAETFHPLNIEAIKNSMESVVNSSSRRNALVVAGKKQYKKFTWEKCVQQTTQIYQKLL